MKKALIFSGISWDDTIQRHHYITFELLDKGYQVDFIESIPSSKVTFNKLFSRIKTNPSSNRKKVEIPLGLKIKKIKILPSGYMILDLFNIFIYNLFFSSTLDNKYDLVINYLPIKWCKNVIERISFDILVYDCVRNFEAWGGYPSSIIYLDKYFIEKSDYVLCDSFFLKDKIIDIRKDNIIQILPSLGLSPNFRINTVTKNVEIKKIVYFGTISHHIDVLLLKKLSLEGYEIHFWGIDELNLDFIVNHGFVTDMEKLIETMSKVGDAIIIPYKGNMNGVIPAKLLQALYTQLPVFSSLFYDSIRLNKYLYVYENEVDLLNKLREFDTDSFKSKYSNIELFIEKNRDLKFFEFL